MTIRANGGPAAQVEFSCLDRRFADLMNRLAREKSEELFLAAAMVSSLTGQGHICVDLADHAGSPVFGGRAWQGGSFDGPDPDAWRQKLITSGVVSVPGGEEAPLVLAGTRLYLRRYWRDENQVVQFFRTRAGGLMPGVDLNLLKDGLARLFPADSGDREIDWQKVAVMAAVTGRIAVITGGPGTGKTFTVAGVLALLLEQASRAGRSIDIALCAPTGKAAARLQNSINSGRDHLFCEAAVRSAIPARAVTLHRLLGAGSPGRRFRYSGLNPLIADVVVVDEASMVDLPMMAALIRALPAHCRLILLGDRDQLASVEPGSVLGDLCAPDLIGAFSADFRALADSVAGQDLGPGRAGIAPGVGDSVIELRKSRRFAEESAIGALSRAVRAGDCEAVGVVLQGAAGSAVTWKDLPRPRDFAGQLAARIMPWAKRLAASASAREAFALLGELGILCALRHGPWGVENVNRLAETILARQGLVPDNHEQYPGRPVLITENNYPLDLFNGDIGVVLAPRGEGGGGGQGGAGLRVFFPDAGGEARGLSTFRLPAHEPAFALTVHKSQGSEFKHVLLILPDAPSPVLCRELIYTALTRARQSIEVWAPWPVLAAALSVTIKRRSGLREGLVTTGKRPEV